MNRAVTNDLFRYRLTQQLFLRLLFKSISLEVTENMNSLHSSNFCPSLGSWSPQVFWHLCVMFFKSDLKTCLILKSFFSLTNQHSSVGTSPLHFCTIREPLCCFKNLTLEYNWWFGCIVLPALLKKKKWLYFSCGCLLLFNYY